MGILSKNQIAIVSVKKAQIKRVEKLLKDSPEKLQLFVRREWTVELLKLVQIIKDKHASGGTTATRLNRITSDLYNSLYGETYNGRNFVNGRVDLHTMKPVMDYAPTHEFGDRKRNIPARLGMRKEFKKYKQKFIIAAQRAAKKLAKEFN